MCRVWPKRIPLDFLHFLVEFQIEILLTYLVIIYA